MKEAPRPDGLQASSHKAYGDLRCSERQRMITADSWTSFWSKKGKAFEQEWKKRTSHVCKPCWELHYCPYGELVEDFPVPIERRMVEEHIGFLKEQLAKGAYEGKKREGFEQYLRNVNLKDYPVKLPQYVKNAACGIFGHICPVFLVNEPLSENTELRRVTRNISRDAMIRVVRRDNSTCQLCGRSLRETEIRFHHKIPFSKGGATDEGNLLVSCEDCNRESGADIPGQFLVPDWPE